MLFNVRELKFDVALIEYVVALAHTKKFEKMEANRFCSKKTNPMEEPKKIVRSGCEASSGNQCFHHKFHFGRSSQLFHHPRRAFHLSFHPLFTDMTRLQLKPRFTQNPCFVSSSSCFSSVSSVAMCWVRLCPRLAQHAHVLFVPISIVVLAIGLLCHSYTFYVPIPHTGGLSIHLLLCRTFTRATFLCMAFSKNLGSHTASV